MALQEGFRIYGIIGAIRHNDPKYFSASIEGASWIKQDKQDEDSEKVHYWVKITSLQTGESVFVDDGFSGNYVFDNRPVPKGYRWDKGISAQNCDPSRNIPIYKCAHDHPAPLNGKGKVDVGGPTINE